MCRMRFPHIQLVISWFLVLCCAGAGTAGEDVLPDPTASLHPTDNIVGLAKLRPLLAKSPDDQHLLGLALMCYVNLALSGEAEVEGAMGPWLSYATTLAERRVKARNHVPAADFASAEPELWVRLLSGYRQEVADALSAWPHEAKSPRQRALAVIATGDWRSFRSDKPRTLHERYAALRIGFEVRNLGLLEHLSVREASHNPFVVANINWRANRWGHLQTIVEETITFTAWMLASSDLDDATALPLLLDLGAAVEAPIEPGLSRVECWRRVIVASRRLDEPAPAAFGAALAICDRLIAREHGLIAADGSLRLYGLGDLAAWNRDRLYSSLFSGYSIVRNQQGDYAKTDQVFLAKIRERSPDSMIVCRYTLGYQGQIHVTNNDTAAPEAWDRYAAVIAEDMTRSNGHSPGIIAHSLSKLAIGRPEQAAGMLRQLMADHGALAPRAYIERFVSAAELCGEIPLILPSLRHWSKAAPMDYELHELLRRWSPQNTMLSLDGRKPLRSWRDTVVDQRTLPWPGLGLSHHFAIRWTGVLRIDTPGSYVLATESDDGSRLTVGEVMIDNSGIHPMNIRRMRADLKAGWLPLTLEFAQGGGDAGCRLLWQPPGATNLVPIPTANLAEREGGPEGLMADGFDQNGQPTDVGLPDQGELAYARMLPWHFLVQHKAGDALWKVGRYVDALAYYRTVLALDSHDHAGRRAAQCLLWNNPPDVDAAILLMREYPDLWINGWELPLTVSHLRNVGRLQEVVDAIGTYNRGDELWAYVRGYAALDRGDLRTARDEFVKLLSEGSPGDYHMPYWALNFARMDWAVLNRLDGKETDWDEVKRGIQRSGGIKPYQELMLDWLSSAASWEDCVARVPMVEDGENLYYIHGLVAMTTGDHATAKMRFQEVIDKHPNWAEVWTCKSLLKWYQTQTPESLAKIATAKPIGKPTATPGKPRSDANDF